MAHIPYHPGPGVSGHRSNRNDLIDQILVAGHRLVAPALDESENGREPCEQ